MARVERESAGGNDSTREQWLSLHLFFAGAIYGMEADRVILDALAPLVSRETAQRLFSQFFFVRYGEHGPHVRCRFKVCGSGAERELEGEFIEHVELNVDRATATTSASSILTGVPGKHGITEIRNVPYAPEVDRYGGPVGVTIAERVFFASSKAAIELLRTNADGRRSTRLGRCILSTLCFLVVYLEEREQIADFAGKHSARYLRRLASIRVPVESWREAFLAWQARQSGAIVRQIQAFFDALRDGRSISPEVDEFVKELRAARDDLRDAQMRGRIVGHHPQAGWGVCLDHLVPSYIHMSSNRLGVTVAEEAYIGFLIHHALRMHETD